MSRLERIESEIQGLTQEELYALRQWFDSYRPDRQHAVEAIQQGLDDMQNGKVRDAREALEVLRIELELPR